MQARTALDNLLMAAASGHTVTARDLADVDAPPTWTSASTWRSSMCEKLAAIAANYRAGAHAAARADARQLAGEYASAFGDDGPPPFPSRAAHVDETDPAALASLVNRNGAAVASTTHRREPSGRPNTGGNLELDPAKLAASIPRDRF